MIISNTGGPGGTNDAENEIMNCMLDRVRRGNQMIMNVYAINNALRGCTCKNTAWSSSAILLTPSKAHTLLPLTRMYFMEQKILYDEIDRLLPERCDEVYNYISQMMHLHYLTSISDFSQHLQASGGA